MDIWIKFSFISLSLSSNNWLLICPFLIFVPSVSFLKVLSPFHLHTSLISNNLLQHHGWVSALNLLLSKEIKHDARYWRQKFSVFLVECHLLFIYFSLQGKHKSLCAFPDNTKLYCRLVVFNFSWGSQMLSISIFLGFPCICVRLLVCLPV